MSDSKNNYNFSIKFIEKWAEVVNLFKKTSKDLSEIKLVCKEGMYDTGTNTRDSKSDG